MFNVLSIQSPQGMEKKNGDEGTQYEEGFLQMKQNGSLICGTQNFCIYSFSVHYWF